MDLIDKILKERPTFHSSETEIKRSFDPSESGLSASTAQHLASGGQACYGIGEDVIRYLAQTVKPGHKTLETGAGLTTLIFASKGAQHIAITPNAPEIERIRQYARENGVNFDKVTFAAQSSDEYLPTCQATDLDLVLLDGKHAFPWPMVDWFYTADRLKQGGLMLVDDTDMRSVSVLCDFMSVDPGWRLVRDFSGKTTAYEKVRPSIHDVAWHMQPWTMASSVLVNAKPPSLLSRVKGRIKRMVG